MTALDRRQFLGAALGSGTATAAAAATMTSAGEAQALARPARALPEQALGILYDSTLCIGCKACVAACKDANSMPAELPSHLADWNTAVWDSPEALSGRTLNIIQAYRHGSMAEKDREIDGFAFVKRHCLHCVDPSCVSVCPVSAMTKDPDTGIVSHDPEACIGCRYCVYGCPFGVPQYDFDNPFGRIAKCQLCGHLLAEGGTPACCDVCPTGASLFGPVADLQAEADRRLAAAAGTPYRFARGTIGGDRPSHTAPLGHYVPAVYGETEMGGTQVRYLAGVPFARLGLPQLPARSYAAVTEGIQHTIYQGMIAPLVLLAGLLGAAFLSTRRQEKTERKTAAPSADAP